MPIPVRLRHRPTHSGLVIPWITARDRDGNPRFGAIEHDRAGQAFAAGWCQIDAQPLTDRIVFAVRDRDLPRGLAPEPGMHPECARYAAWACPMLNGTLTRYRTTPTADLLGGVGLGDPHRARPGHPAEQWHLLWTAGYQPTIDPTTGLPAALLRPEAIRRIRPLGSPGPPGGPR